jgi:hypothetical protein
MTGLLSTISGSFSKALIFGVFLPSVIFTLGFVLLVAPLLPESILSVERLKEFDSQWQILAASFAVIVLSGLLYSLNIPLIRIYEGYPWEHTVIGKWRKRHFQAKFRQMHAEHKGLRTLIRVMNQIKKTDESQQSGIKETGKSRQAEIKDALSELLKNPPERLSTNIFYTDLPAELKHVNQNLPVKELWAEWSECLKKRRLVLSRSLRREFPLEKDLVLPTRLGNVIRSFEDYSRAEYKLDAIALWSRLQGKVDKDYAALIDDSKTAFDFLLNCSFLSLLLTFLLLVAGLQASTPFTDLGTFFVWMGELLGLSMLSLWFYRLSIGQAASWGEKVKGAIDLYRNALLIQLGFTAAPATKKAERDLWLGISRQIIYGDSPEGPQFDYNQLTPQPPAIIKTDTNNMLLTVERGFEFDPERGCHRVVIIVRNETAEPSETLPGKTKPDPTTAKRVVISDAPPAGWVYRWNSAQAVTQTLEGESPPAVDGKPETSDAVKVEGIAQYDFHLGDLKRNQQKKLTYEIFQPGKAGTEPDGAITCGGI